MCSQVLEGEDSAVENFKGVNEFHFNGWIIKVGNSKKGQSTGAASAQRP